MSFWAFLKNRYKVLHFLTIAIYVICTDQFKVWVLYSILLYSFSNLVVGWVSDGSFQVTLENHLNSEKVHYRIQNMIRKKQGFLKQNLHWKKMSKESSENKIILRLLIHLIIDNILLCFANLVGCDRAIKYGRNFHQLTLFSGSN